VVHGVWGSDISIAMVVPRSGTKPCGRQGLAQVSQRERAQMEPSCHVTPKYAHAVTLGRMEKSSPVLAYFIGWLWQKTVRKGFSG
jgi:hypothetical protein